MNNTQANISCFNKGFDKLKLDIPFKSQDYCRIVGAHERYARDGEEDVSKEQLMHIGFKDISSCRFE